MRFKSFVFVWVLLASAAGVNAFAQSPANAPARTIEVSGHGDAKSRPDTMILSFSVDSEGKTADDCTRAQAENTNKVIEALRANAGASAKIDTSDFSFNPEYGYVSAPPAPTPAPPKPSWTFKAQVTAFGPLENLGSALQAGLAAGASGMGESGMQVHPWGQQSDAVPQTGNNVSGGSFAIATSPVSRTGVRPLPSVSVEIQAEGASPPDAIERGATIERRVEQAMLAKLNGKGGVDLTDFEVTKMNPPPAPVQQFQPQQQTQQVQRYVAHATVTVETHDLNALGTLIEGGIKAGAKQVNQVTFTLGEDSDARKRAIEKAAEDAKSKAATLAKSMGVKLGGVVRITTNAAVQSQVVYGNSIMRMAANSMGEVRKVGAEAPVMTVAPHEIGYAADVTATYQIE